MSGRIKIALVLEGSYPYITGGVSAWTHDLILNLPDFDFILYTISPEEDMELRYTLPENVVLHHDIVLNKHYESTEHPPSRKDTDTAVLIAHDLTEYGDPGSFRKLVNIIPEGYFLYDKAINSEAGWQRMIKGNLKNNPIYAFTDYYWAWKSAFDMLFTIIGSRAPQADIYHAISTGFAGIAAISASIRHNKPCILTEHGLYHKEREMEIRKTNIIRGYQRDMWTGLYNNFSTICYKHADKIISLFEENRRKQHELGADPAKTEVIPNGIDIQRFMVEREEKEGFHVGLVGRVVPIKDIKTYISTAKIVLERIPEAIFYCIGPTDEDPGYYRDCVMLTESLKITDRFIFTGRQNVLNYYKFLDVMALTSVREAQPLVILEAYCAGVPVVSTGVGNVPEMLDYDERFISAPKDAQKLASAIIYLYSHPDERKSLIESNRYKTVTFYDKTDLHKKYSEIYTTTGRNAE